ncbi:Hypothetical protein (Fragment), partial [Durusdinium trenchii]
RAAFCFVGVSSTCELRWLRPAELLKRLPTVQCLELELVGFLGEIDPDNSRVPDPVKELPEGVIETQLEDRQARETCQLHAVSGLRATKGSLEDAVKQEMFCDSEGKEVLPQMCFIAHPQLHRYYTEFHPAINWLIKKCIPTVVIGASHPDPSWKQDEHLLQKLGATIVVSKRENPYPMCLPGDSTVKKCSHIIGFCGGKAIERDKLMSAKIELLSQDYVVR